jgi:hypothetical protein
MKGLEETAQIFGALPKEIQRARINGINKTATEVRREEIVVPISRDTGIKRKTLNDRIRIERARAGKETARIVPNGNRTYSHAVFPLRGELMGGGGRAIRLGPPRSVRTRPRSSRWSGSWARKRVDRFVRSRSSGRIYRYCVSGWA